MGLAAKIARATARRWRVSRLLLGAALCLGVAAPQASAAEWGMSDGRHALFDSQYLHALDFKHVRLVLPWNAARDTDPKASWRVWLERARLQGFETMVAPTIDTPRDCDSGSCSGPTPAEYADALRALLAEAPGITAVEAWNEPNHALQPTRNSPALAAAYFEQARAVCGVRCTAVAGNMLDGSSLPSYLSAYRAALVTDPAVWGIHNYFDATYFGRSGVDLMLSVASGPVWLTETGGLVTFRSSGGVLPYDEDRAADSLRWLFTIAARTPRVERAYLYGMWQQPWNSFDSALLRLDNSERESMQVVRDYVGKRKVQLPGEQAPVLGDPIHEQVTSPGPASSGTSPQRSTPLPEQLGRLRASGKRVTVDRQRRAALTLRCIGGAACVGRVELGAGRWRYQRRVSLPVGGKKTIRVRLPARVVRRVDPHLPIARAAWAAICDGSKPCGTRARVKLRGR